MAKPAASMGTRRDRRAHTGEHARVGSRFSPRLFRALRVFAHGCPEAIVPCSAAGPAN